VLKVPKVLEVLRVLVLKGLEGANGGQRLGGATPSDPLDGVHQPLGHTKVD
jgi:hypothetical protein